MAMTTLSVMAVAFLATGLALTALYPIAERLELMDHANDRRKIHTDPVPLIGGIAIAFGVLLTCLALIPFTHERVYGLLGGALLLILGMQDDRRGLDAGVRLLGQTLAALIMTLGGGITLHSLGDLFGFGVIDLGLLAVPFTVFATVGIINAFNMIDGIDGLAGGLVLIVLSGLLCLEPLPASSRTVLLMLIAALLPYLICNLGLLGRDRRVFLGDAGSMLLGYIVVWLLVRHSQAPHPTIAPVTALWLVAMPLMDTLCVMTRRLRRRCSPFKADRCHLHHLLIRLFGSQRRSLVTILLLAIALAGIGVLGQAHGVKEALMFYLGVSMFLFYLIGLLWLPGLHRRIERRRRRSSETVPDAGERS